MEEVKDLRIDERQGMSLKVEELMRKIPGYSGYLDREKRREADKIHRDYVASRLTSKKGEIQALGQSLLRAGGMKHLADLDGLTNVIDRLTGRTRHAVGGSGGFFAAVEVDEALLDRVYEHDLAMLHDVEALDSGLESLRQAAETNDNVTMAISKVRQALTDLDAHLDLREKILKGLE